MITKSLLFFLIHWSRSTTSHKSLFYCETKTLQYSIRKKTENLRGSAWQKFEVRTPYYQEEPSKTIRLRQGQSSASAGRVGSIGREKTSCVTETTKFNDRHQWLLFGCALLCSPVIQPPWCTIWGKNGVRDSSRSFSAQIEEMFRC